eukprot:m.369726 g.369726  ORF g.369726 m.369726 type:complete len:470 (+) comp20854_c0_seq1:187-1596(+)
MAQNDYGSPSQERNSMSPNTVDAGEDIMNRLAAWDVNDGSGNAVSRDISTKNGKTVVLPRSPGRTHTTFAPRGPSSTTTSEVDNDDPSTPLEGSAYGVAKSSDESGVEVLEHQSSILGRGVDACAASLKREVMMAFYHSQSEIDSYYAKLLSQAKEALRARIEQLQREVEELTELVQSYMQSAEAKDVVIANLKEDLEKEKWGIVQREQRFEERQEGFEQHVERVNMSFARRHHTAVLMRKTLRALHSVVRSKWRQRVERACKTRAEEVCTRLQEEHGTRERSLQAQLDDAQAEIRVLQQRRREFQDGMKKAFLRGVCAINSEADMMWPMENLPRGDGVSEGDGGGHGSVIGVAAPAHASGVPRATPAHNISFDDHIISAMHGDTPNTHPHTSGAPNASGLPRVVPATTSSGRREHIPRQRPPVKKLAEATNVTDTRRAARGMQRKTAPSARVRVERHAPRPATVRIVT